MKETLTSDFYLDLELKNRITGANILQNTMVGVGVAGVDQQGK